LAGGGQGDPPSPRFPPSQCYGGTSRRDKLGRFELWSAGINGIDREKTPSVAKAMEGRQMEENSRNFDVASRRDGAFGAGLPGRHSVGKRHGQRNKRRATKSPRHALRIGDWREFAWPWLRIGRNLTMNFGYCPLAFLWRSCSLQCAGGVRAGVNGLYRPIDPVDLRFVVGMPLKTW
jgi:hypothetical protein